MANCTYCNQPAGVFHHSHPKCREEAQSVYSKIRAVISDYIATGTSPLASPTEITKTTPLLKLEEGEIRKSIIAGFTHAVDRVLENGLLSEESEHRAVAVIKKWQLTELETNTDGLKTKLVKSAVLRDLTNGTIPRRFTLTGFNLLFAKGESVIWGFHNVQVRELKTHRQYRGSSHGYSVRIAKGVYYRTSAFRGVPVETQSYDSIGTGALIITNKHLFLVLAARTFKIPLAKLISITPYSDGFGLQRDTARDSSFLCTNLDGWFAYNVVSNLASL